MTQELVPFEEGSPQHTEIDLLDTSNPRSVLNLAPLEVQRAIQRVPPEYWDMTDSQLDIEIHKVLEHDLTVIEKRVRNSFWREYNTAQALRKPRMYLSEIIGDNCSRQWFLKHMLGHPLKVAWLCTPPGSYVSKMEEMHMFSIDQLRDIMERSHIDRFGELDPKIAAVKVAIFQAVDMRLKGAHIQRTQNVHAHLHQKDTGKLEEKTLQSLEEIDRRIKELENETQRITLHGSKDQTPTPSGVKVIAPNQVEVLPKEEVHE